MKVDSEFNFGFEIMNEDDITRPIARAAQDTQTEYMQQAVTMRQMILPLLHNLAKKPESEYIKWPNRSKTINEFITKLFDVTGDRPMEEDLVD